MRISDWSSDVCSSDLSMALDVTMTGPLEKLVPFHMTANSRGRSGAAGVTPVKYDSMTRIYDDGRAVRLTYGADGAVAIEADPPTVEARQAREKGLAQGDRKSTRLNSSH